MFAFSHNKQDEVPFPYTGPMASPNEYSITREEALCFLRDALQMDSVDTKLKTDKIAFLAELIKAIGHHIPYQTVTGLSTPHEDRRLPTATDIKKDLTSKVGGLCYQLNVFGWMLLRALGFDALLVVGDCLTYKGIHIVVIINNVTEQGSRHIFDVGMGFPILQLIPLDFEQESPEYSDSYMRYRFVRQGDEVLIFQLSVDTNPSEVATHREYIQDGWISFMFIHLDQPVSVPFSPMTRVFTDVDLGLFFLASLRCLAYPNGRMVCIQDSKLLLEDEEHRVQVSRFTSRDDIVEAFARYFPQFPEDMVNTAIEDVTIDFKRK